MFIRGESSSASSRSRRWRSQLMAAFLAGCHAVPSLSSYAAVLARLDEFGERPERSRSGRALDQLNDEGPDHLRSAHASITPRRARPRLPAVAVDSERHNCWSAATAHGEGCLRARWQAYGSTATVESRGGPEHFFTMPERVRAPEPARARGAGGYEERPRGANPLRSSDLRIDKVVTRAGGLDAERDWTTSSLRRQQLLVLARLLIAGPPLRATGPHRTALTPERVEDVLDALSGTPSLTFREPQRWPIGAIRSASRSARGRELGVDASSERPAGRTSLISGPPRRRPTFRAVRPRRTVA